MKSDRTRSRGKNRKLPRLRLRPEADGGMLLPPFLPPTALPALPSFLHTMTDEPTTLVYDEDDDIIAAPTLLPLKQPLIFPHSRIEIRTTRSLTLLMYSSNDWKS